MILKKCVNGTEQVYLHTNPSPIMAPPKQSQSQKDCSGWDGSVLTVLEKEEALEEVVWNGMKMWHLIFLSIAAVTSLIILLCCCVKFRIPRTKQEIEADYIRRKILRKFRKRLKAIQNQELDEMDLKKALDKIRAEFKSDSESLAASEAGCSGATNSSIGHPHGHGHGHGGSYRRASQLQIDISLEELRAQSLGFGPRLRLALCRICGRGDKSGDKVALTVDAEGQAQISVPEGAFKTKEKTKESKDKDKPQEPPKIIKTDETKKDKDKSKKKDTAKELKPPKEEKGKKEVKVQAKEQGPGPSTSATAAAAAVPHVQIQTPAEQKDKTKTGDKEKKQKDKEEKERKGKEKAEKEKADKERKEREKKEKERLDKERKAEKERAEKERKEKERAEKERIKAEKAAATKKK